MAGTLRPYRDRLIKLGFTEDDLSIADRHGRVLDIPFSKLPEARKLASRVIVMLTSIEGLKTVKNTVDNIKRATEETDWIKNNPNKSYITDGLITIALRVYYVRAMSELERENRKPNNKPTRKIIYNPENEPNNNKPTRKIIYNPENEPNNNSKTRKGGRRKGRRYSRRH